MSTPPTARKHLAALWLALYYTAILLGVIALHANSSFKAPPFVYGGL